MRPVAIVTDSTHYTTRELIAGAGRARGQPLRQRRRRAARRETEITDYDAFYARLREGGALPTHLAALDRRLRSRSTSRCSPPATTSSRSTSRAGSPAPSAPPRQAKALLDERGAGGRASRSSTPRTACGGLGCVVLAAAAAARGRRRRRRGARARPRGARRAARSGSASTRSSYLQRGGRIGRAQAWLGGALKIKPILSLEAEITPVERVRTAGRAFERMVDYLRSRRDDGADGWVIQHIQAPERAAELVERGRELFGCEPQWVSEVGPVIGTYTGPGLLGVGGVPARLLR